MARASAAGILNDGTLIDYARKGALATLSGSLPADDSLCHGTLGNLLSIEAEGHRLAAPVELSSFRGAIAERFSRCVPRVGMPEGVTTVRGLMLGTAGIIYALSKQIDPSIPNVMILE
jgi:putative lantibiotic modifying enzyme